MATRTCFGGARMPSVVRCPGSIRQAIAALRLEPIILLSVILLSVMWTEARSESGPVADPTLVIANGTDEQRFTLDQLLHRPDAVTLNVTSDVYDGVSVRAVPLL